LFNFLVVVPLPLRYGFFFFFLSIPKESGWFLQILI